MGEAIEIHLRDLGKPLIEAWNREFAGIESVRTSCGDIFSTKPGQVNVDDPIDVKADAIVSPANSFGFMDGGIDMVYTKRFGWGVQERNDHSIGWSTAFAKLWPQMLLGVAGIAVVGLTHPVALPYIFFLVAGGPALAVPLCVLTSWPRVGLALQRAGIGRLPEETEPPAALSRRAALMAAD